VMTRNSEVSLADLLLQQKISNRLLAAQLRATMRQMDLIVLLATTGASHADIAAIVGTTPATVQNALARTRKKQSEQGRRKVELGEEEK